MGVLDFKIRKGILMNESAGVGMTVSSSLITSLDVQFEIKIEEIFGQIKSLHNLNINEVTNESLMLADKICDEMTNLFSSAWSIFGQIAKSKEYDSLELLRQHYKNFFLNADAITKEGLAKFEFPRYRHPLFDNADIEPFMVNLNMSNQLHDVYLTPYYLKKAIKYGDVGDYAMLYDSLLDIIELIFKREQYQKLNENRMGYDEIITENYRSYVCRENEYGDNYSQGILSGIAAGISVAKRTIYDLHLKITDGKLSEADYETFKKVIYTIHNQYCLNAMICKKRINDILNEKQYYEAVVTHIERVKKFLDSNSKQ